ncbi:peptidoglycan-binding domain-containing protein [Anaerocolumna aminovalerica]|uniref:peptidoglycan-binding domain-containing protein n=1 Tax=Anaerocolumna aminovalerica TaxID=1527 RepID=UPI002FE59D57
MKKVQKKLNELGYDCGTPDGIMGKKTKKALKEYQEDYNLTVDGVIGKEVKKSMGID